jgi:hypothetical protein
MNNDIRSLVENERNKEQQQADDFSRKLVQKHWELPIPFEALPSSLPMFPIQCFPDWIAEFVEAVAEDTQTPGDMAAVIILGVLSIPCNKVYKIEGKPGWQEPMSLYCASIAKPGERKSAIMAHIAKPIYEYEAEINESLKSDIARNRTEKKILEDSLNKLQAIAAKDNSSLNMEAALSKAEELEQFKEIKPVRFVCDDVTTERLVGLLIDQGERMAITSSEGGIFGLMEGRYSEKANLDVFLKGHSGDPLRVDRVGRSSEGLSEPTLTMALTIQPNILTGLMRNETFRGRGLTARFLYSLPISKVGARNIECEPIPGYVKGIYWRNIRTMLEIQVPEKPYILRLSNEAYKLSIEFAKRLEPRLINDLEHIADWASKLHGAILRTAGILHAAEHIEHNPWEHEISLQTFSNAILIGEYFIEHAKAAFALMGADKNIEECKYVLRWIEKQEQPELKKRDILRGNRRFKKVEDLEPILKLLCEHDYLRECEQEQRQGPGRKPDTTYLVNPLFLNPTPTDIKDTKDRIELNEINSPLSPYSHKGGHELAWDAVIGNSPFSHISPHDTTSKITIEDIGKESKYKQDCPFIGQ